MKSMKDKPSKIGFILVRLAEILELFSYFNLVPAVLPLLIFGTEEWKTSLYFIIQGTAMLLLALVIKHFHKEVKEEIPLHCNIVSIVLAWILIPLLSCFVYYMNGLPILDAYFESVSAWTTTGFTIYESVGGLPHQIIFWRSFEQWMGGLGIVAFVFFLLDQSTNPFLFSKAEGRSDFIKPTMRGTLKTILKIYAALTFIGIAFLSFTGMDLFTSLNMAMTAVPTGGLD
ncbi:MAG: potassium transporter TrkG [Candidatus Micrarchaeia archaeon]